MLKSPIAARRFAGSRNSRSALWPWREFRRIIRLIRLHQENRVARLNVNGKVREFAAEDDTPLLWVLREQLA